MPSFFQVLGRIIQGKPVFDPADSQHQPNQHVPEHGGGHNTTIEKFKDHTFPVVQVEDTESHEHGHHVKIYCVIKNEWGGQVFVDKIRLLGTTKELDFSLRPHEQRQVLVYSGPALTQQKGSEAQLEYKTNDTTGDYFQAVHEIRYMYTSEKTYEVTDLRLRRPIRDIYG